MNEILGRLEVLPMWFYLIVSVEGFQCCPCLCVKGYDIISSLYQDCWFCFFLLTFLLLYMAAAPNAACLCFIQPLLYYSSKLPADLSRGKSKAHPGHRPILLHGPSLK